MADVEKDVEVEYEFKQKPIKMGCLRYFLLFLVLLIVLAFAVPMYADYRPRIRVIEGLELANSFKNRVIDYYANHDEQFPYGTPEEIKEQLNLPVFKATEYIENIRVLDGGVIEIEYTGKVEHGKKLLLIPNMEAHTRDAVFKSVLVWHCRNGYGEAAFTNLNNLPAECRQ